MDTFVVKDFDTAIDALIKKIHDPSFKNISFSDELNIKIKMEGEQWDGKLDYRVAEFIVKLQKSLLAIYNEYSGQKIKYNTAGMNKAELRVTVTVEKGCTLFQINLGDWAKYMQPEYLFWGLLGVAAIWGGTRIITTAIQQHSDKAKALELAKIEAESKLKLKIEEGVQEEAQRKELVGVIGRAMNTAEKSQGYLYSLAAKMKPDEKMVYNGEPISAADARTLFHHAKTAEENHEEHYYFLDGDYVVSAINREKEEASIRFKDKRRKFSLVWLEGPELEVFYKSCASHKSGKQLLPVPLQLKATFVGGVFKSGIVQGVGDKREGAMTFTEAALDSARRQEEFDTQSEDE